MSEISYRTDLEGIDWQQVKERNAEDDFDNGRTAGQMDLSFKNSAVVCIAHADGGVIGTVRALSDWVCNAYIVDVWTYSPYRRQGIARRMMEIVTEKLQGQHVYLFTDDAQSFYESIQMERTDKRTGYQKVIGEWLQNDSRKE
jgi:ribosomal protein S18 acetylase RimI-like enzyme